MSNTQEQIAAQLLSNQSLPVSRAWLTNFISSTALQRTAPLSVLTKTALFRVLASDFRESLSTLNASLLLPADIADPNVKERRLLGPIPVQVVDIEDIGTSIWSQVEAIERAERGEFIRGREIIRTVNVGNDEHEDEHENANANANANGSVARTRDVAVGGNGEPCASEACSKSGPHRLVLEDAAGTRVAAIELRDIREIATGKLPIGTKLLLRQATVARGMVLLVPECLTILGGKNEAMDGAWKQGRKERLVAKVAEKERGRAG